MYILCVCMFIYVCVSIDYIIFRCQMVFFSSGFSVSNGVEYFAISISQQLLPSLFRLIICGCVFSFAFLLFHSPASSLVPCNVLRHSFL